MKYNIARLAGLAFLLAGLAAFSAPDARAQLGVAGGLNYDNLSEIDADTDRASGYHVGLFYDARLGPLSLRPGVFYMDVGEIEFEDDEVDNFDLQLVEIPIDARFRFGAAPFLKPYLMAGPVFRINASSDDFEGEVEDFSVAANAGVGVELTLPGSGLRLYPEVRYAFGISDFASDLGVEASTARLNTFMLRLGVAF